MYGRSIPLGLDLSTAAHVGGALGGAVVFDMFLDSVSADSIIRTDASSAGIDLSTGLGASAITIIEALAGGWGGAMIAHQFM